MLKVDTLNIACRHINFSLGFHGGFWCFSVHVKKHCFLILHDMVLTHALWNETFLYSEVPRSFLVNTVQTLSKSVYNCLSYWQKFRGTFFMAHCVYISVVTYDMNKTPCHTKHLDLFYKEKMYKDTQCKDDVCFGNQLWVGPRMNIYLQRSTINNNSSTQQSEMHSVNKNKVSFTLYDLHTMDSRQIKKTDDRLQ